MAAKGGLSDDQIEQLRTEVADGRTPRVHVTSSQLGGLTAGTVRAVGDPAADGEDFVTVRVKVNGVTDDLRFAPRELARGRRGTATPEATPEAAPARAPREASARRSRRAPAAAVAPPGPAPLPEPPAPTPRRSSRRAPSTLPVTIAFTSVGATWTVSAQRGARPIVKAAAVNPGVVSALAGMLELPALDEAVAAVNDTARAEAETRAEQLRAELAQIEAVLKGHERPKRT